MQGAAAAACCLSTLGLRWPHQRSSHALSVLGTGTRGRAALLLRQ